LVPAGGSGIKGRRIGSIPDWPKIDPADVALAVAFAESELVASGLFSGFAQ
jgi:hypothetical protein